MVSPTSNGSSVSGYESQEAQERSNEEAKRVLEAAAEKLKEIADQAEKDKK